MKEKLRSLSKYLFAIILVAVIVISCAPENKNETVNKTNSGLQVISPCSTHFPANMNIIFKFIPALDDDIQTVFLTGDFNGWNPVDSNYELKEDSENNFILVTQFGAGSCIFKIITDGQWAADMREFIAADSGISFVDDGFGGKSAVLNIE